MTMTSHGRAGTGILVQNSRKKTSTFFFASNKQPIASEINKSRVL